MAYAVMAYTVMACVVMAYALMAYVVLACIVMTYLIMVHVVMAYTAMACIVMAFAGMAHTVMACIVMCTNMSAFTCLHARAKPHFYLRPKTEFAGAMPIPIFFEKSTKRCGIVFFEVRAFQRYAVCLVWTMSH